jgi:hypothetical protein
MRQLIYVAIALGLLPSVAYADNPCQYIGIIWRSAKLGLRADRPIVQNEFGTWVLKHDEDEDWTKVAVDTNIQSPGLLAFAYSYDQWTPAQKTSLSFPGGPKIELKEVSEQAKDNPQLWIQHDQFEIGNGTITKTVTLPGVREFGHAFWSAEHPKLIYLLPQDSSDEDASCGPDDGPGLVEINVETLDARILFQSKPMTPDAGTLGLQIVGNNAWMLTSTGVCKGDLATEKRVCWGYWKGLVDPKNVHPFFVAGYNLKDKHSIAMAIPHVARILSGRKWTFDDKFFFEIEPSSFYKGKRIYLDRLEIEPVLTRGTSGEGT